MEPMIKITNNEGDCTDISIAATHLGINPVSGGRPPKDKIIIGIRIFIVSDFIMLFIFTLNEGDILLNIIKIGEIIIEYTI
jgi:hypothetical protein